MFNLIADNVHKSYGPDGSLKALKGVSIEVRSDERVALLGRSGSGKSTLMRCINRLVEPDSGDIVLDDVNITRLKGKALRQFRSQIGMVFQEFNLVNRMSVIDNVLCGCAGHVSAWRCWFRAYSRQDVEKAEGLLQRVGLADQRFKRADELSGGQRQRVGIARALMQEPKLLLADEPTASLDPEIGRGIMELIFEISEKSNIPVLISMHDVALATQFVERIIALKDGNKVYDGNATSVDLEDIYKDTGGSVEAAHTQHTAQHPAIQKSEALA
ncbi:MAG: phosphonate ABC transporter ATP-binding protein [Rhodospirillales bacterium]